MGHFISAGLFSYLQDSLQITERMGISSCPVAGYPKCSLSVFSNNNDQSFSSFNFQVLKGVYR